MRIKLQIIIISIIVLFLPAIIYAAGLNDAVPNLIKTAKVAEYNTKNTGEVTFDKTLGVIINTTLSFLGVVFLVLMIYGGFLWMTDRGNESQLKRAQNLITAAVIGLIIVLSAYAISFFVLSKLQANTLNLAEATQPYEAAP